MALYIWIAIQMKHWPFRNMNLIVFINFTACRMWILLTTRHIYLSCLFCLCFYNNLVLIYYIPSSVLKTDALLLLLSNYIPEGFSDVVHLAQSVKPRPSERLTTVITSFFHPYFQFLVGDSYHTSSPYILIWAVQFTCCYDHTESSNKFLPVAESYLNNGCV